MKLGVYSVHDKAVMAFMPPFYARHKGEAIRSFFSACTDSSHQFAKHLTDYVLYELGVFDDVSGLFEVVEPVRVISGFEVVGETASGTA